MLYKFPIRKVAEQGVGESEKHNQANIGKFHRKEKRRGERTRRQFSPLSERKPRERGLADCFREKDTKIILPTVKLLNQARAVDHCTFWIAGRRMRRR